MSNPPLADNSSASTPQRPWTVLIRDGIVVARYRAEDNYATDKEVTHASFGDGPVRIYEVSAELPAPPPVGESADPQALQWVHVHE